MFSYSKLETWNESGYSHSDAFCFLQLSTLPTRVGVWLPASISASIMRRRGGSLTGVTTLSHAEFDGETVLYSVLQSTCSSYTDFYEPTFGDMSVYRRLSLPWRVPTHWDQIFCNDDCPRQRQTHRILNLLFPEQDSELVEQCCEQGLCQLHRPTKWQHGNEQI
jgi:hypothetical protein